MRGERMCQEEEYCMTRDTTGMHLMSLVPRREAGCMKRSETGERERQTQMCQC